MFLQSGVCAAGAATVYADKVTAKPGETVLIPVKIKDNPGMMGFKITLEYPTEIFSQPKAMRGAVTTDGLFNDSITQATNGSFDVIWSGTQNVTSNGVLVTLMFAVNDTAPPGSHEISLSFSQADTFNEKYEDVLLDCKKITLTVGSSSSVQVQPAGGGATIENGSQPTITETTQMSAQSKATEEAKAEYVSDVLMKIDSTDVADIVNSAVKKFEVKSVAEVPPDKQAYFVKAVEEKLISLAPDIKSFESSGMDTAQAVEAIEQLAQAADEFATEGVNIVEQVSLLAESEKTRNGTKIIIVCVAAAVILVAAGAAVVINKDKKKNDSVKIEEENTDEKR